MEERAKLAPFASVEDLSDGDSPPGKHRLALPDTAPGAAGAPKGCAPPRIDISRASSSSHHEDSSPERDLFAGAEGSGGVKLGLGFSEEMALELRSSTEELDFHGPPEVSETTRRRRKTLTQQHAYELEAQTEKERKDSACSDIGLLSISGRTSRLSSIGSGGSAASGMSGVSHVSGGSHLSAVSQLSKTSRCSSPHRTLLETSFCGPKPIPTLSLETEYPPAESVEAALLARNTDPAGAVLPVEEVGNITNGIQTIQKAQQQLLEQKAQQKVQEQIIQRPQQPPPTVILFETTADIESPRETRPKSKPKRRPKPMLENELQRIIPLHSEDSLEDDTVEPEQPQNVNKPYSPENGIYIPLKGPDPIQPPKRLEIERPVRRTESDRVRKLEPERTRKKEPDRGRKSESKSERTKAKHHSRSPQTPQPRPTAITDESELFRIIPLHGDTPPRQRSIETEEVTATQFVPWNEGNSIPPQTKRIEDRVEQDQNRTKPATLDLSRLEVNKPAGTLDLGRTSKSSGSMREESRTPSPATSVGRGSLFRRSSESSSSTKSKTSYSADSKSKKDSRNKSVFTSLFKKGGSGKERDSIRRKSAESERHVSLDPKITNVEFTFSQEKIRNAGPDAIVIPLHSPDSISEPLMIYDPETETMVSTRPEEEVEEIQRQYQQQQQQQQHKKQLSPDQQQQQQQQTKEPQQKKEEQKDLEPQPPPPTQKPQQKPQRKQSPQQQQPPKPQEEVRLDGCKEGAISKTPSSSAEETSSISRSWSTTEGATIVSADVITHSVPEETTATVTTMAPPVASPSGQSKVSPEELLPELLKLLPPEPSTLTKSPEAVLKARASGSEERKSSESEQDSDAIPMPSEEQNGAEEDDQEKKGLVHQPDSLEDELPYVPTTLPQERSVAHPIIPIKQRVTEVKTYPIERPRSTTPINPATLDDYITPHEDSAACPWDKMQIVLPRTDSIKSEGRPRSPCKTRPWTHFAEQGLQSPRRVTPPTPPSPPPLPPRVTTAWVSFDEVPERRRAPKRITTLPSAQNPQPGPPLMSYVNPEECSCECHEAQTPSRSISTVPGCGQTKSAEEHQRMPCGPKHRTDSSSSETLRRDKSKTRSSYRT